MHFSAYLTYLKDVKKYACFLSLFFTLSTLFSGCDVLNTDFRKSRKIRAKKTIIIQPIKTKHIPFQKALLNKIKEDFSFKNVAIAPVQSPPKQIINYEKGFRYSAPKLLSWLKQQKADSAVLIVGLTDVDIYTTKRNRGGSIKKPESKYKVWGIFGLATRPGTSCIVSTKRLKTSNVKQFEERLLKVVLHEIGHNLGLKHCENKSCYMTDAVETIRTIDNASLEMCEDCKAQIGVE